MEYSKFVIGVDVDNTLTALPPFDVDTMILEETREIIRSALTKQGTEILSLLCIKPIIITGRGDYFHDDTIYWLEKNDIPYTKLVTIDRNKYSGNRFDFHEYINYKVNEYLENNVQFCLEDDIHVINALEKHGIKCSLVKDDFEEAFHKLFEWGSLGI